jgi:tRNA(Leu) C34 or U34 (ribose-2'-O)-methylase TrmL
VETRSPVGASLLAKAAYQTPQVSNLPTLPQSPYNCPLFPEGTPLVADKRYSCIGLYNPKSPENVGSVMRAAGCYGVASVFYTGKRYERAADFVTDTKRVHYDIPLIGIDDLKKILPLNCVPVAVELVDGARPLPEYTHPDRALYIFGPEDGSLDKEIRDWCEDVVYIPTTGCMNLAATVNVVLYDRMAKGLNTRSGPKFR